jgi:hypothetical protein
MRSKIDVRHQHTLMMSKRVENNESEIQLENNRMSRHSINEFKTKNMIAPQNRLSVMSG